METPSNVFADQITEILKNYIKTSYRHISAENNSYVQTQLKEIDTQFKKDLNTIAATLPQITWKVSSKMHFLYHHTYEQVIFLNDVLPLTGLKIMASVPNSAFDVSLLEYYRSLLDYCKQNSATFKDKTVFNIPDILNAVDFLLNNQKEMQEQLRSLPKEEALDRDTRDTTFTQEKFAQLLFLCLEAHSEQGRAIFDQHVSAIKLTPELLSSVISSYSDETFQRCQQIWVSENPATSFPQKVLNNVLIQYVSAANVLTDDAFKRAIKRISSVNQKIRWEKPDTCCYLSETSEQKHLLRNILPLKALEIMASFPNTEFDLSLLDNCLKALACGTVKDKKVLNLSSVLDSVNFLLEQKGIQEQLALLPQEQTVDPSVRHLTFTQEKFTQLLLLCRETNLGEGLAILEQYGSNIQVTPELLNLMVSDSSSNAMFQWCAEKWAAENPKRRFPKEDMINMLGRAFSLYLAYYNNLFRYANQETALKTATETFKSNLNRIIILKNDIKWDSSIATSLSPPAHLCIGEAVFLSNVLPLPVLVMMQSSCPDRFDISLLTQYYKAFDYCRKNSAALNNKKILNLPDILNAIDFLLKKKEIQAQLTNLTTEESAVEANHNDMETTVFTQEKFTQLSLLCHEFSPEHSPAIFEQCETKTEVSAYLLASLASWSSNASFEKYVQPLAGNLPNGTVRWLIKKYTAELDQLKNGLLPPLNYSEAEIAQKTEQAFTDFKVALSRLSAASPEKPLICRKKDFGGTVNFGFDQNTQRECLRGLLPIEAIKFMKTQPNVQFTLALFMDYLSNLVAVASEEMDKAKKGEQTQKITNYDLLLENIKYLMQDLDTQKIIDEIQSTEDYVVGLWGMHILQLPQFYQPIYTKFCTANEKKTPTVQKYLIAALLKLFNKLKCLELIALFSTHPHTSISPKFLKVCAELDYYEGLACILERRPEFLENLPISNKMLKHNPKFEALFQQRLKTQASAHEDKNTAESHELSEDALIETFNLLHAIPNIYILDMMPAIIQIIQFKRLLNASTQEVTDLAFGSFVSIWDKKGIPHPEPLAVSKNGESLLGNFYGYKPELYTYLLTKLRTMLPYYSSNNPLSLEHKQFCFKLAVLFPNTAEVDVYIEQLNSKINNDNNVWDVITDAANFKIPTQGYWDIEAWFAFVKRNQFSTRHMAFLRAASDLDMKMVLGDTIFCKHRAAVPAQIQDQKTVQESILQSLTAKFSKLRGEDGVKARDALWARLIQQCPLAYQKLLDSYKKEPDKNKLAAQLAQQKDRFKLLLKNILDLYDLGNPAVTLPNLVALRLQDFPELPKEYKDAVCTALENGYSNEDIRQLTAYLRENKQPFTFVPSVVVDGTEIDDGKGKTYNKCELRLLEKTDPMALVAGLKTRCCQHFNNAGAESAMHAYHSVYGATYRLAAKKDPNDGDWFAQSWTVLSECGTILLFDSIEFSAHADEQMVLAFFKKLAEKLLRENPHLQEIWVGASQHARLKLAKHGYTSKPVDENFRIAGYSKDSYTDSDKIVVLMRRADLKETQEAVQTQEAPSVVLHVNSNAPKARTEETKQTQEETKQVAEEIKAKAEYRLGYGVDTYLKPGKVIKFLGLSKKARQLFNTTHEPVISLLMEEPENPLLEEGFVSSDPEQTNRYREGEYYITYQATMLWLENTLNPKLKASGLAHHVYAAKENDIRAVLQEAQQNTSIKTFTVIAFIGIHAVSIFVDPKNGVCYILDSEPGTDFTQLKQACKSMTPNMRVITPEADLRLQRDFYSCATFAAKFAEFFAKNAKTFSKLLQDNETDTLATADMPAGLLKMAQTPLTLTDKQKRTVVSKTKNQTLLQYNAALKLTIGDTEFNTAALKTRQNILKQIHSTMKPGH